MEINKFTTTKLTDNRVDLYLPIEKVDRERRIVSGFATLDNLDKHNDVVTAEASRKAFKSFRGNIREMHMPKAVGKMVNFTERKIEQGGQSYDGIYVEVYVSKGAQDTWEKVLDGTLSGFSIGGHINPQNVEKSGDVRVIKDYDLVELSLVDTPANPLANVFSVQKSDTGYTFSGFATEDTDFEDEAVESVQKADTIEPELLVSDGGNGNGVSININTTSASTDEDTLAEGIASRVWKYLEKTIGGNTMTTQTEETAVEEVEDSQTEEVVESPEDTAVEKAADVSEVEEVEETSVDAEDNNVDVDAIVEKVLERLQTSAADHSEVEKADTPVETDAEEAATEESNEDLTEAITKAVEGALAGVADTVKELTKTVSELKEETNTRLSGLEDVTAVKKSAGTGRNLRKREAESDFWANTALGGTKTSA